MAACLGPAGIGLMGTYVTITTMATALAGLGIGRSGVRQIAEAAGTGDSTKVARSIVALRRTAIILGAIGAVFLLLLSRSISNVTFKSPHYALPIAVLAATVFIGTVSAGQTAVVLGMRRIADLSRLNVLTGLLSTLVAIPLVFWLGQRAIVPFLVGLSLVTILCSWWYARKVRVQSPKMSWRGTWTECHGMLKIGMAFLVNGVLLALVAYIIRVLIIRGLGVEAAGQYQAAFTMAGLYVGFVQQAAGADFFPRLTAVAGNHVSFNRLVNEQSEVALLLVGPGILLTLAFAPLLIYVFYGTSFKPAIALLRCFALGSLLGVMYSPIGYVLLAKGLSSLFICSEILSNAVYVGLVVVGLRCFGLMGTAFAFVGSYVFSLALIAFVSRKLTGFRWSKRNLCYGSFISAGALTVLSLSYFVSQGLLAIIGASGAAVLGLFSIKRLLVAMRGTRLEAYIIRFSPPWLYSSVSKSSHKLLQEADSQLMKAANVSIEKPL